MGDGPLMRWVTTQKLEEWARTLGSRVDLGALLSDLCRASAPDLAAIRFPSGDKGQVRGFDGRLVSQVSALNVPEGESVWEFGVIRASRGNSWLRSCLNCTESPRRRLSRSCARAVPSIGLRCLSTSTGVDRRR